MIKSLIATTQMIFGYILFASILNLILPAHTGNIKIVLFVAFLVFIKVSEHPTSHYNPFAFSLEFRSWVHVLFGGGYDEPEPIDKIQDSPKKDE
jgi:hypothetical protein